MKRRLLLLVTLTLACLLLGAAVVFASAPITVVSSDARYVFQKEARFALEATGEQEITGATLSFRLADQPATTIAEKRLNPARTVSVEHVWDVAQLDLPSGTIVTYWWTIEDKAGNKLDSERRTFLYEDSNVTWKKINREDVTLAWYKGDEAFGRLLLGTAVTVQQRLAGEFGVERKPAMIYIYGSYDDLRRGIGSSANEWTGGRAYPESSVVLIGVPPADADWGQRAVAHEFAHLIVDRATSNPFTSLPRWLDEGLAMWAEGDMETQYSTALRQAVRSNQLLSLKTLSSNFPADSRQANLAYAESYSVVAFIRTTMGSQKIAELLQVFREGNSDDDALMIVLGLTTDELDTRWRASLGLGSAPDTATPMPQRRAISSQVVLIAGALLGVVAVLLAAAMVLVVVIVARA